MREGGDVAQGVLGDGEDDGDDGKAHDEPHHQGVALFIGHAEAVAPQVREAGSLEVPRAPQTHDAAAEADEGLLQPVAQVFPAEPGAEQDDGSHDDVFHAAAEFVAPGRGPRGPEPRDQGRQAGNEDGHAEQGGHLVFHSGGQVEGAEEAQHHGGKGRHDFHDGFYHPLDGGGHEVSRVNGGHDRYRNGEDEGVQGAFQRAEDQGHQGELGFIVVRAAHGLPEPFGGVIPFIPDFPGQGFGACFRVPVFHGEEVDLSPDVHGNGGVEFRAGRQLDGGEFQRVAAPADVSRGSVAEPEFPRSGDQEGTVDAGGGVMLYLAVQGGTAWSARRGAGQGRPGGGGDTG